MEIKLDEELLQKAINEKTMQAVEGALGSYDMRNAIATVVSSEVVCGVIANAVKSAVLQMDHGALAATLGKEIQRASTRAVMAILEDGLTNTICKLRGIADYTTDDKNARARIRAELFPR